MFFCLRIDSVKILSLLVALLVAPMTLQAGSPDVAAVKFDGSAGPDNKRRFHAYPHWPPSRQAGRVIVPPPPPGPYMSSALNDFSGNRSSFPQGAVGSVGKPGQPDVPRQALNPDVPWPENLRTSKRWLPENGYRYEPLQSRNTKKPNQQAQYNSPPNYNQGYRRNTTMSAPDPRWTPSTGAGYGVPYSYAPAIRTGQVKTVDRTPYPTAAQP